MPQFLKHCFINRKQTESCQLDNEEAQSFDSNTMTLQMQVLSGDFQCMCGKMHAQILFGMQWCAMSIFFFLKFYNFVKGIMRIHSILKKPKTNVFTLINFLKYLELATERCIASKV